MAPNGICQLEVRGPPGGDVLPSFISCWNVASHSVRKHNTWRAMPVAMAIIAAMIEPPGPKVSMPPLIHVGRMPSAPSSAVTPPSPMPAMSSPGYVDSPSMSSNVNPASAIAASHASMVSDSGGTIRRRPSREVPMPVMAERSSNFSPVSGGRT